MSWVFVNAGQCGNQVGHEIIDSVYKHLNETTQCNCFFEESSSGSFVARSVSLDTEEKVVQACFEKSKSCNWKYDSQSISHRYGGAGNNWAMGYMANNELLTDSINCIRKQIELCDLPAGLFITHSVGGGTGSGFGTKLTETLHDEFNEICRVNCAITPYHFGEVIVQHYNTVLCLSAISTNSDAIFLFENEVANNACKSMLGIDTPSLLDVNRYIASNLLPILLPKVDINLLTKRSDKKINNCSIERFYSEGLLLNNDITAMCSHPYYKFLSVYNCPQSSASSIDFTFDSWSTILNSLARVQMKLNPTTSGKNRILPSADIPGEEQRARAYKSLVTFRGLDPHLALQEISNKYYTSASHYNQSQRHHAAPHLNRFQDTSINQTVDKQIVTEILSQYTILCTNGIEKSDVKCYGSNHLANGYQRSACLVSNDDNCVPILERSLNKASSMFEASAYLHHYFDYGLEAGDFRTAMQSVYQSVIHYKNL